MQPSPTYFRKLHGGYVISHLDADSKESGEGEPDEGEQESGLVLPLYGVYDDGFALKSVDDQYQLRFRSLTQVDGKIFSPADQEPARNGIYIPRFRIYLEGQLTDRYEYELSLQRSVEGTFDVLDANVNFVYSKQLQLRIGRALVPYSYAWYDHLEQYYVTPERGLFPLNLSLARQAGIFVHVPTKTFPTVAAVAWLKKIALPEIDRLEMNHLLIDLEHVQQRLKELEKVIARRTSSSKEVAILASIPGMGRGFYGDVLSLPDRACRAIPTRSQPRQLLGADAWLPKQRGERSAFWQNHQGRQPDSTMTARPTGV